MRLKLQRTALLLAVSGLLLLIINVALAQKDTTPKKRLRSPATVKGFIGGESHDSYVIRARQGQIMTVQISWLREDDNQASFTVSASPNFFNSEAVTFGKESQGGRQWTGKIPKTGEYFIYVVAHPTAQYTLKVTVK